MNSFLIWNCCNKTDKLDSEVILDYCIKMSPKAWVPPTPEQRQLRSYVRHRDALVKTRTQQKNRLSDCKDEYIRKSIQSLIDSINKQIEDIMQKIKELIKDDEPMKKQKNLLTSINGIGDIVALTMMAEMPDLADYESAHAAAADAGVTPAYFESGDTIRRTPNISKIGKSAVRGVLYFPAMNAIRTNPVVKALAERLEAKGKNGKVIIVAAMRKLIHLAYGVLKNQTPFDPEWTSKPNPKPIEA
ncbi:MAG: IS110 family transposase [Chloroflexota bacterium]